MTLDLDLAACRGRQKRLLEAMSRLGLDRVIVTQHEHVQYLAGPRFAWLHQPTAMLDSAGKLLLVAPNKPPAAAAADEILTYEAQWHSTLRNDQRAAASEVLLKALAGQKLGRIGVEFSTFTQHLSRTLAAEFVDIEPELYRMRRKKDPDELARLRKAIDATGKMYAKAREMVRPGVNELDVFNELQAVAVREFGEMLTGTGNDYACNARGGPPRDRICQAGELYILDLGPAYRGYFADNCRAIAVDGNATKEQQATCDRLSAVFPHLMGYVKPGKSCKELFNQVQTMLDQAPVGQFNHHLGHGIGLFPHEGPHLNPFWDDHFEVGDVFTAEPGLYDPTLKAGIRLENDYLVTETGVELLSDFPLNL
jgi:Xaa-Pro dipeptidase